MIGVDCGAASRAGPASSRVLVAGSNVSTPANEAAAITALMNFNMRHPFVSHTNWFQYSVAAPNTVWRQISTCGHFANRKWHPAFSTKQAWPSRETLAERTISRVFALFGP